MDRSKIIHELIRELKLYREYLLNYKAVNELKQEEESGKKLIKK